MTEEIINYYLRIRNFKDGLCIDFCGDDEPQKYTFTGASEWAKGFGENVDVISFSTAASSHINHTPKWELDLALKGK